MKSFYFGLKLGSTDIHYIDIAIKLYENKYFSYIELFAVPNSYDKYANVWKEINIPFIIHAPHFSHGLNFADYLKRKENATMAFEAIKFCDKLESYDIIFHPGVEGDLNETIYQINSIKDKRMIIENKPFISIDGKYKCRGATFDEMKLILNKTNLRFCLDFGHAICSANSQKIEPLKFIESLLTLNPSIYHLTDGFYKSEIDSHEHYGEGDYPLCDLLNLMPDKSRFTNEAKKNSKDNLDDFVRDYSYIIKLANIL